MDIYISFQDLRSLIKRLIPNKQNIVEFFEVLLNLITLNRRKKFDSSHSDSFNIVFFTIFHLLLVFMLFTGLQLYVHGLASGHSSIGAWWPAMLHLVTDWTLYVFGGNMGVRIAHHYAMYFILSLGNVSYLLSSLENNLLEEGDIAIVIGGSKFVKEEEK